MSEQPQHDEWIAGYLEGTLVGEDRRRLAAAIHGHAEREQEFVAQVRLHLVLGSLMSQDAAAPVLRRAALIQGTLDPERRRTLLASTSALRPARARPAVVRLAPFAAAAILCLAIAGAAGLPRPAGHPPSSLGLVAISTTPAVLERGSASQPASGSRLQVDDLLVTGAQGGLTVEYPGEATRIAVGGSARLAVLGQPGKRFRLVQGEITVEAAPQPPGEPLCISTPCADLTVVGTAFSARCNAQMTWLDVSHGAVRFAAAGDQQPLLVGAGQQALANGTIQIVPRDAGSGLLASYFDGSSFERLSLVRIDPVVDFDWHDRAPDARVERERFSVRWSGEIDPLFSEVYRFHIASDDGARLWIDGRLVIDNWHIQSVDYAHPATGTVALTAHRRVGIRLDYFEYEHLAAVRLTWQSPSQVLQVVPPQRLFPSPL